MIYKNVRRRETETTNPAKPCGCTHTHTHTHTSIFNRIKKSSITVKGSAICHMKKGHAK